MSSRQLSWNMSDKRPIETEKINEDDVKRTKLEDGSVAKRPNVKTLEEKITRFTHALTGVVDGVQGILRMRTPNRNGKEGQRIVPYAHQMHACKRALSKNMKRMLLCHDAGLGKTVTYLLIVAGMHIIDKGVRRKTIITCPKAVVDQWYIEVRNTLRIPKRRILKSTELKMLTREALDHHDVIITSKDAIGAAFGSCYAWYTKHHQVEPHNHWVAAFDRKPGTELHHLFDTHFDLAIWDEVHFDRNANTRWTQGHQMIARNADKVIGLSGTPVMHSPKNFHGIATGMDLDESLKIEKNWFTDKAKRCVNLDTVRTLKKITDRADDTILNLPPLTHHSVDFDAAIKPEYIDDYNEILLKARKLRGRLERRGRATQAEMHKLMSYLQTMQQFIVSPLLAKRGAFEIKTNQNLCDSASRQDTGALRALKQKILELNARGFDRIMVAACHTSLLKVATLYLEREAPSVGALLTYDGSLTLKKRADVVGKFLDDGRSVLMLSIQAGGTGLHLVPGSNAVIFFGSLPFSPMEMIQTAKRVHRIGQEFPVEVHCLVAKGSVNDAITLVHKDKLILSKAILDDDMGELEANEGMWRTSGRIVDGCRFLSDDGKFPEVDLDERAVVASIQSRRGFASAQVVGFPAPLPQMMPLSTPHIIHPLYTIAPFQTFNGFSFPL